MYACKLTTTPLSQHDTHLVSLYINCVSAVGATLMKAVYGLEITDEYIKLFADAFSSSDILLNGSILDFLPFLAHVPTWLPGTAFLRRLAYYREVVPAMRDIPWMDAKAAIVSAVAAMISLGR